MNLIKSKNFKSGSFKGNEHSYIDSINGTTNTLASYCNDIPSEKTYTVFMDDGSDDIRNHFDKWEAQIKKCVPLVHRDLEIILYRAVCYVLSGFESKEHVVSEDVMKLIQNIVRLVGSKITIIHHIQSLKDAEFSQVDSDGGEFGHSFLVPNSTDGEYKDGCTCPIDMFNTDGDTPNGRASLICQAVDKTTNLEEAQDLLERITNGVLSYESIAKCVADNSHGYSCDIGPAGVRAYKLRHAIHSMALGLTDIINLIRDRKIYFESIDESEN